MAEHALSEDRVEAQVLHELSRARSNPAAIAASIRERLSHFQGNDYFPPDRGGKTAVVTKEGQAAVRDAIAYLEKQGDLPPLADVCSQGLRVAAEDHLTDLGTRGAIGHQGADGSSSSDRMMRYGAWSGKCGECLWFGRMGTSAQQIVEDLIVDDGVPSRGHRLGIYDPAFRVAGIRLGSHKTFGACCVIDFAMRYDDNEEELVKRIMKGPPAVRAGAAPVKTQWNLGQCPGCGETIHGGAVVEAMGRKWHRDCFACQAKDCGKSLRGVPYQEHDGMPYCKDCHCEKFGSTCYGCGEKIRGGVMKAMGQTWHKECFVCGECRGKLEARFATRNGKPLCGSCNSSPMAKCNASQPKAVPPKAAAARNHPRASRRNSPTPNGSAPKLPAIAARPGPKANAAAMSGVKVALAKQSAPKMVAKSQLDALIMDYSDLA